MSEDIKEALSVYELALTTLDNFEEINGLLAETIPEEPDIIIQHHLQSFIVAHGKKALSAESLNLIKQIYL